MPQEDSWYRSSGWNDNDQKLFYDKISRSRSNFHRQQYARIKALSLIETNKPSRLRAAIKLLDASLSEWCGHEVEFAETYATLGRAYKQLGDYTAAALAYETSIKWHINLVHRGYWDYPEMIISLSLEDKYSRALEIVNRTAKEESVFDLEVNKFIYHAVRAIVFAHRGLRIKAQSEALAALETSSVQRSVFRFHPKIGLVDARRHRQLIKKLKRIAF